MAQLTKFGATVTAPQLGERLTKIKSATTIAKGTWTISSAGLMLHIQAGIIADQPFNFAQHFYRQRL